MKQGTVRVSEEFIKPDGTKKWYAHEKQYNQDTEDPLDVFAKAESEMNAYIKKNSQGMLASSMPPGPPAELPVINKEHERLEMLIDNSKSIEELMGYKNNLTSPFLANCFWTKHQQLVLQPNK